MTATPESISTAALQAMLDAAPADASAPAPELTPREMVDITRCKLHELQEEIGTMFAFKLIALEAISHIKQFHDHGHDTALDNDDRESALCWARDAGKAQASMGCLKDIFCGPQDFICADD